MSSLSLLRSHAHMLTLVLPLFSILYLSLSLSHSPSLPPSLHPTISHSLPLSLTPFRTPMSENSAHLSNCKMSYKSSFLPLVPPMDLCSNILISCLHLQWIIVLRKKKVGNVESPVLRALTVFTLSYGTC